MTLKYIIGLLAFVTYTITPARNISCNKTNTVIACDDIWENVKAAQKNGLIAIHFKNVTQLKRDLARYHIHV